MEFPAIYKFPHVELKFGTKTHLLKWHPASIGESSLKNSVSIFPIIVVSQVDELHPSLKSIVLENVEVDFPLLDGNCLTHSGPDIYYNQIKY